MAIDFQNLSITSIEFAGFVTVILAAYYLLPKLQKPILFGTSLLFCFSWGWETAVALVFSFTFNYFAALSIHKAQGPRKSKFLLIGILVNLINLFAFKYFDVVQDIFYKLAHPDGSPIHVIFPLGISFYTLQAISYLVDVYNKQLEPNSNFIEVALYLVYFPKLTAGPIERAQVFFEELRTSKAVENRDIAEGFLRIALGLFQKFAIADFIVRYTPPGLFTGEIKSFNLWFWGLAYLMVVYNDFAGYTNIARGVSSFFGIKLSPNFEQPLFSTGIIEFWTKWHISLSNWLRDYVYLPVSRAMLRKNPSGKYLPNLIIPPIITMLASGLWHGSSVNFLLWGGLSGIAQAVERVNRTRQSSAKKKSETPRWQQPFRVIVFFLFLIFISVPFKMSPVENLTTWLNMLSITAWTIPPQDFIPIIIAILATYVIDAIQKPPRGEFHFLQWPQPAQVLALSLAILVIFLATREHAGTPFIYQEF